MNFLLLTHSRELTKSSNTGRLVLEALGARAKRIVWQRKAPDEVLLRLIDAGSVLLLYPELVDGAVQMHTTTCNYTSCVIIDSTWQEARKIYNRSAYLHQLPRLRLNPTTPSNFRLRRNQKPDGLSTVEAVVEVLKINREVASAADLLGRFDDFQQCYSKSFKA